MLTAPGTPASSSPGPSTSSPTVTTSSGATRLMLKQTPIDVWSLREQLGLASAVLKAGDQNWVSVSRQMKPFSEEGRPHDWFSQKNCALQYNLLLEKVDTPRRKRGDKHEAVETPGEAIVRRLKAERLQELKRVIEQQASQMQKLEEEVRLLSNPETGEDKIDQIERTDEIEQKEELERQKAHEAWLAEREEKKLAIQAALKAHSAKLPLKGAAAAAVSAANIARRSSAVTEELHSFSDVDSPVSQQADTTPTAKHDAPLSMPETSSPLISSPLKSCTTSDTNTNQEPNPSEEKMDVDESDYALVPVVDKKDSDVDMDVDNVKVDDLKTDEISDDKKSEEISTGDEVVDQVVEVVQVSENPTNDEFAEPTPDVKPEPQPEDVKPKIPLLDEKQDEQEQGLVNDLPCVDVKPDKNDIKVENGVAETTDIDQDIGMKETDEVEQNNTLNHDIEDERSVGDIDTKKSNKINSPTKSLRQPRKTSEIVDDENGNLSPLVDETARRETRSKRTSERSEDQSHIDAEESPLPPPANAAHLAARETRRSAAKKAQSSNTPSEAGTDDLEFGKEEDFVSTPIIGLEHRRISKIKETPINRKTSRRGSGATTASRSSSPVVSGDESEPDSISRSGRSRRRSGRPETKPVTSSESTTETKSEDAMSRPVSPEIGHQNFELDEWVKSASNILDDFSGHRLFAKIMKENFFESSVDQILRRPCGVDNLRKSLEEGSFKSVHEFHSEILLLLVSIIMAVDSDSELVSCAQALYSEFNESIQESLLPFELKSVTSTPAKANKSKKRHTTSSVTLGDDIKRKRGASLTSDEISVSSKKRKRI